MSHMVETMAYAGQTPWHGLGEQVDGNLTPQQMLVKAGLDWNVERKPVYHLDEGSYVKSDEWNILVRSDSNKILGPCGKNYVPIQNDQVFRFFKEFTESGDMSMDTAGSLDEGRQVWGLAKIREGFKLPGGDEIEGHLLISHPHQWGKALTIMFTPIRVVCNNTLTMALGESSDRFRMPHVSEFNHSAMHKAKVALGLATSQLDAFKEQAQFLAKKRYTEANVERYITALFHPTLFNEKVVIDKWNNTASRVHELLSAQPGAKMSEGSWWTALNAVTYYHDHEAGRDRNATLKSAWFGSRAAQKRNALTMAMDYAKAA